MLSLSLISREQHCGAACACMVWSKHLVQKSDELSLGCHIAVCQQCCCSVLTQACSLILLYPYRILLITAPKKLI